ncbi:MAG: DNA mismatch repair protein MutS [Deltaproteobacteria bacterium]|nr:DNA mismatch repair protein MutS [Deltaproteobacteria bacterium]MBN2674584.1 DNA mismatch repair protein MutS [Deltaproteobacteria bacterium]
MNTSQTIKEQYEHKIETLNAELKKLDDHNQRFAQFRLIIFLTIIGAAALALLGGYFSIWWGLLPIGVFVFAVAKHDRVLRLQERVTWSRDFYTDALARIENRWQGKGIIRTDLVDDDHLFALDLDIFGKGSLFDLMCTAKTASGEAQLAAWLSQPSRKEEILARQDAVRELTDKLQLREDIYLCTRRMSSLLNPARLTPWATAEEQISQTERRTLRVLFYALAGAAVAAAVSCFFSDFGLAFLAGVAIVQWIAGRVLKNKLAPILQGVEGPKRQLKVLSDILARFEQQEVNSPMLRSLKDRLYVNRQPSSAAVARLGKLVDWMEQAKNQVFAPVAFLLMWNGHFALAIEKWRHQFGKRIPEWLDAAGQLEALSSVAGYAFEHPEDPYPLVVDDAPLVAGEDLGHPLISAAECVRNSVSLNTTTQVWVVSGSNMSGKSTFLRVIGINAVLAMCGAPICGKKMTLSPVAIGSTIRVLDSLQKGTSRFYAEISTLKQIVELTDGEFPLLFLLDEIFHGTNSHDRKIGAQAVVEELVNRGALGLVTTHDLALTKAAEALGETAKNVHFDDQVIDGRLHFDYSLKDGPVTRSNALELMRSVGLNV